MLFVFKLKDMKHFLDILNVLVLNVVVYVP